MIEIDCPQCPIVGLNPDQRQQARGEAISLGHEILNGDRTELPSADELVQTYGYRQDVAEAAITCVRISLAGLSVNANVTLGSR